MEPLFNSLVRGWTSELWSARFDIKKLDTSLYRVLYNTFQYIEPFKRGSPVCVWQPYGQNRDGARNHCVAKFGELFGRVTRAWVRRWYRACVMMPRARTTLWVKRACLANVDMRPSAGRLPRRRRRRRLANDWMQPTVKSAWPRRRPTGSLTEWTAAAAGRSCANSNTDGVGEPSPRPYASHLVSLPELCRLTADLWSPTRSVQSRMMLPAERRRTARRRWPTDAQAGYGGFQLLAILTL